MRCAVSYPSLKQLARYTMLAVWRQLSACILGVSSAACPVLAQPGQFVEDTASAIVSDGARGWLGAYWGDVDLDGDLDLLATDASRNDRLYWNHGGGQFEGVSLTVSPYREVNGGGWADVDRDGDLDFFAASIAGSALLINTGSDPFPIEHVPSLFDGVAARDISVADHDRDGDPDMVLIPGLGGASHVYRNVGFGFDFGQTLSAGGDGTTACWADYDSDGDSDLYTANASGTTSVLYRNDASVLVEVVGSAPSTEPGQGQGCSWGDYDGDGDFDLFVARGGIVGQADRLFRNDGGTFIPVTEGPIVADNGGTFGSAWGDIDNDGDLDLVVANRDAPDVLYLNEGGEFEPISFGSSADGWSIAVTLVDHDGDGDLDLFTTHGGYAVPSYNRHYINVTDSTQSNRHWLALDLRGRASDRFGLGARATVYATIDGTARELVREVFGRPGRMAQDGYRLHFGLHDATVVDSVAVVWPVSGRTVYQGIEIDSVQTIEEGVLTGIPTAPGAPQVSLRSVPNPTAGLLTFSVLGVRPGPTRIVLFDALGRRVAEMEVITSTSTSSVEWPASARLLPGRYFARLENAAGSAGTVVVVR